MFHPPQPARCAIALVASSLLFSATATAQAPNECGPVGAYIPPESRQDVTAMALRGLDCFRLGRFGQALALYRLAYTRGSDPLLEAAIGRSLHELGLWSAARSYYSLYLKNEQRDQDGRARIEERLSELDKQLDVAATLTVNVSKSGATILIGPAGQGRHREDMGSSPSTSKLRPGVYEIRVEEEGYHVSVQEVELRPEQEVNVDVELIPQRAAFTLTTRQYRRAGALTMLGAAPFITIGGVVAIAGDEDSRATGYAMLFAGSLALVTGGALTAIGHQRERQLEREQDAAFTPYVAPNEAGFTLTW